MALIMEDMAIQLWVSALPYSPTATPTFTANSAIIGVSRSVEYSDEFDSANAGGAGRGAGRPHQPGQARCRGPQGAGGFPPHTGGP